MKDKGSQAGWGFWLGWVLASTMGMLVGFMMMFFIAAFMSELFDSELLDIEWLFDLFAGIMLGIGVGILQWLVLRQRVSGVGWWILASVAAGYGIFLASFIGISESLSFGLFLRFTGVAALGGAVTGILQWLVLRGKVSRAGWWVLASTVGWALGMAVSRAIPLGVDPELLVLIVAAAVMGAVTGGALVWLLRQPVPEA
jgi:hypothetical protein